MKKYPDFSVLLSLFLGENPEYLDKCLASLACQTLQPSEIILILDGAVLPVHMSVIDKWSGLLPLKVHPKEHTGLALSLQYGLVLCEHDLVVRTDTDDRSLPTRFEKLVSAINDSSFSVVSGNIAEVFPDGTRRIKSVPSGVVDKSSFFSFFRSPLNHNNCVIRRQHALAVGGYTAGRMEDFRLWIRLLAHGYTFYNIPGEILLEAFASNIEARRCGNDYIWAEILVFFESCKRWYWFGIIFAMIALVLRVPIRFKSAASIRKFCYDYFLRSSL